jgi:hypothetical protein
MICDTFLAYLANKAVCLVYHGSCPNNREHKFTVVILEL